MKTMKLLFTLLLVAGFATVGFGQIAGTSHDMSGELWNAEGEICIVCHTPHNALASNAPLWNRAATSATFTVYSGTTLNATVGQPTGQSLLCLSCHDGTVGLESYGSATATLLNPIGTPGLLGVDLSNDHPISFAYDDALATADGELHAPSTDLSGLGSTIDADMLFGGQMQCASCHDVHDDTHGNFLIMSNSASALCLTCHDK
ncbi:MAG: cytochrome c3 family protein [Bacteroidota bacterium]